MITECGPLGRSLPNVGRATLLAGLLAAVLVGDASSQRVRQGLLSLDDARLFYEVVGTEGDPIFVVHGGPGLDHAYLRPGLDVLATRNTLVYFDQRGVGRSSAELDPERINLAAFVADIEALRATLGYERITLLAHSFGSLIALEYARLNPESLRALILMAPVEPGSRYTAETEARQEAARTPEDAAELETLTRGEGFEARDPATVSQVLRVLYRRTLRDPERVTQLDLDLRDATAKNGAEVGRLLGESLGAVDWWDRLAEISVPTLVLHGRYDVLPVAISRGMAEALPSGRLVVLASGHFPYLEDPDGLLSAVSAFLVDLSR